MRDDVFIFYCVGVCFADFINEENRGVNFTWEKWLDHIVVECVQRQCYLEGVDYDSNIVTQFSTELLERTGLI